MRIAVSELIASKNICFTLTGTMVFCGVPFSVIKVDDFTHHLWVIYQTVLDEGNAKVSYLS